MNKDKKGQSAPGNIILTGFSFTGKSIVGRKVARQLGWGFVDTDGEIVSMAGKPIPDIFSQDGEEHFRKLERQVLETACQRERVVVATGGGAVLDPKNRELMFRSGVVICLEATSKTIYERLLAHVQSAANPVVRPLLSGADPQRRIESLKQFRQPYYDMADWTIHTDAMTIEEVCQEVMRCWDYGARLIRRLPFQEIPGSACEADSPYCEPVEATCVVRAATESYPVFVGCGLLDDLGRHMQALGLSAFANVISDEEVFAIYGAKVERALTSAGFAVDCFTVPAGEKSKSFDTAIRIYDWLVERRAERGHAIVALGGGMVGDLAGFVAATFLRGLPLVQVPTTLVAMADASIGGKVALNHPQGKNLIGAFYQPSLVLADVHTLKSLPRRELTSGWAEVAKHGLILDPKLFEFLEDRVEGLIRLEDDLVTEAIGRSAALKAQVVSEDEKERGRRIILNYGHTIAHGLEAATGYEQLLHGEAVALGMMGAALISQRMGLLPDDAVESQRILLERFGLPTTLPGIDLPALLRAMELDKKIASKAVRWVLLEEIGRPIIREDVPREVVLSVLEGLFRV